jgi:hypothetical protein
MSAEWQTAATPLQITARHTSSQQQQRQQQHLLVPASALDSGEDVVQACRRSGVAHLASAVGSAVDIAFQLFSLRPLLDAGAAPLQLDVGAGVPPPVQSTAEEECSTSGSGSVKVMQQHREPGWSARKRRQLCTPPWLPGLHTRNCLYRVGGVQHTVRCAGGRPRPVVQASKQAMPAVLSLLMSSRSAWLLPQVLFIMGA